MKPLTANEIARTAHVWKDLGRANRDKNDICVSCKNEDTDIVRDPAILSPFKSFYGNREFRVLSCACCGAVFSWGKM